MAISFSSKQQMQVDVSGPKGANRLYIISGIVKGIKFHGAKGKNGWRSKHISFKVGPKFKPGEVFRATTCASFANISNDERANWAGWRIDAFDADWDDESGYVEFEADISARDSDGYVDGISYTVYILAKK